MKKLVTPKKPKMVILVILDIFSILVILTLFPSTKGFPETPKNPIFDHF